jgi:hypothetical protein
MAQSSKKSARKRADATFGAGVVFAAMGIAGTIAYLAGRKRSGHGEAPGSEHAAAFAPRETDKANFDQTRHAGAESMRDQHDEWDELDEQLDASFPSSDPPSFNPGVA